MKIEDFFDPSNIEHLLEWEYLCKNGHWQKDSFILDYDLSNPAASIVIAFKIAKYYTDQQLKSLT
ncbi:MAG: hypothetical protein WC679_01440 [Bacteroidales bacterium]|jgi:hypothetical protein